VPQASILSEQSAARRPFVEGSNKNQRGYYWASPYGPAHGIERNHCTKSQIAWTDE
jgi:hypothetical protein